MSEYQDYFFSEDGFSNNSIQYLNSPNILRTNHFQHIDRPNPSTNKDLYPTDDYPDEQLLQLQRLEATTRQANFVKEFIKKQKRIKRVIEVSEQQKFNRIRIFKGLKDDTTQLNINFKTIFIKKFRDLLQLKEISIQQKIWIQNFRVEIASFNSFKNICKSKRLKQMGLKFIKSSELINKIQSSNSSIQNKLTMIKYIESLRKNFTYDKVFKWKQTILQL